ncbi:MAG: two-component regulator propeller domain-containing protein, partial [Bacteroidota bacterium]
MTIRYGLYLVVLSLFGFTSLNTQPLDFFHHIGVSDGLSQNFIRQIHQTADGFVWIGTQVGLDRYDSHEFRAFRADKDDPMSLPGAEVWSLLEAKDETLWVGTSKGLARYQPQTENFEQFLTPELPNFDSGRLKTIRAFIEYPQGILWVSTEGGMLPFSIESGQFGMDTVFLRQQQELGLKIAFAFTPLQSGNLLIASEGGLFILETNTRALQKVVVEIPSIDAFYALETLSDGSILAGTNDGLLRINFNAVDSITHIEHQRFSSDVGGSPNFVADLLLNSNGGYYAATGAGLRHFNWQDGQFSLDAYYQHDPDRE